MYSVYPIIGSCGCGVIKDLLNQMEAGVKSGGLIWEFQELKSSFFDRNPVFITTYSRALGAKWSMQAVTADNLGEMHAKMLSDVSRNTMF